MKTWIKGNTHTHTHTHRTEKKERNLTLLADDILLHKKPNIPYWILYCYLIDLIPIGFMRTWYGSTNKRHDTSEFPIIFTYFVPSIFKFICIGYSFIFSNTLKLKEEIIQIPLLLFKTVPGSILRMSSWF